MSREKQTLAPQSQAMFNNLFPILSVTRRVACARVLTTVWVGFFV